MRALSLSLALLVWATVLHGQAASSHHEPLVWGPAPAAFPTGAKMAVVAGDPGKEAPFTVELALPDGYRIPAHFHPTDETVSVKEGTFLVGMGDSLDLSNTNALKVGASGKVPAQMHHYAAAQGATVVEVTAMGPFAMTYVHQSDDPRAPANP